MGLIKTLGRYAWRKYVTDGVFSSGYNKPDQIDIFPFVDAIDNTVTALSGGGELQGGWNASGGVFPGAGTATTGQSWIATTPGTVGGVAFRVGDRVIALTDNASTATYAGNWQSLPASVDPIVPAEATGGTANAIEATTSEAITGDASQVISILWAENNAGAATVRFNGEGPTYPIKTRSGADVEVDYLVAGVRDIGQIVGGNFQLLSEVGTAAAAAAAQAAADAAVAAAASVNLPASPNANDWLRRNAANNGFDALSTALAWSALADQSAFDQAATGSFFETDGIPARIHRVNDRLLLGDATDYDGSSSLVTGSGSWLWDIGATSHMGWIELNARVASVSSRGIGITGAVQQTLSGGNALGGVFYADNNRAAGTSTSDKGWGAYVEARQGAGAGNTAGIETNITKLAASSIGGLNPYSPYATGHAVALRLASGGDANVNPTTYDAEAAVQVINNGAKFLAGIVFGDTALTRDGGATGRAHAMRMPYDTAIEWYEYTTSALAASIASQITSTAAKQELRFSDTGMALLNGSSGLLFEARFVASAVNYFRLAPATTGNTPTLSAQGSDTNINIALSPKGTGRVVFGSFTSSGDVAITGSVEIRTSEGTIRKLAVIA